MVFREFHYIIKWRKEAALIKNAFDLEEMLSELLEGNESLTANEIFIYLREVPAETEAEKEARLQEEGRKQLLEEQYLEKYRAEASANLAKTRASIRASLPEAWHKQFDNGLLPDETLLEEMFRQHASWALTLEMVNFNGYVETVPPEVYAAWESLPHTGQGRANNLYTEPPSGSWVRTNRYSTEIKVEAHGKIWKREVCFYDGSNLAKL